MATGHGPMRRVVLVEQAVLLSAATVMAARLYVEGRTAAAPTMLIAALAVTFTLLRGVSAYINYVSELQDGSEATDRVQLLSGQLLGRKQKLRDLQNNRALLIEEAEIAIATLERLIAAGPPGYSAAEPRMRHAPGVAPGRAPDLGLGWPAPSTGEDLGRRCRWSSMVQLFIAALAAAALILTSGYAFGTVRRRKAVKELIEIRDQLGAENEEWRATTATLITRELTELDRLSDPSQRWLVFVLKVMSAAVAVSFLAAVAPALLPGESHKHVSRYVGAGSGLVGTFLLTGLIVYMSDRLDRWWKQVIGFAVASIVFVLCSVAIVILIQETPYYYSVFSR